jgi:phosphoadenosine phosphosulfate reductase
MTVAPKTPLCWIRVEPVKSPECVLVRDVFLRRFPKCDYHETEVVCEKDEDGWHATGTLEKGIKILDERFGPRTILGIRAEESSHRFLSIASSGCNTKNKSRPCGSLTEKDVFGLLSMHDLPIHPAYAMTGGGRWPREHLRVASLGGKRGQGFGRLEWEREYYADELRRIGE